MTRARRAHCDGACDELRNALHDAMLGGRGAWLLVFGSFPTVTATRQLRDLTDGAALSTLEYPV